MEEATVCTVAVWFALILYTGTITLGGKKLFMFALAREMIVAVWNACVCALARSHILFGRSLAHNDEI